MAKFLATFTQSIEGIERVEVIVNAQDEDHAVEKIDRGDFSRYRVVDKDLAIIKRLGDLDVRQVD